MKIKNLGANKTELRLEDGTLVFFSYSTPVAACLASGGFIRTSEYYSRTTTKHINAWLGGAKAVEVPQAELDTLAQGR